MTQFKITLESIQHLAHLTLDLDLSVPGLVCLVGRNGTGKTTLVRALRNLANADTFISTATPHAFSTSSKITYVVDGVEVLFDFDRRIRSLNCRQAIPPALRNLIAAELPIPHGSRFNYFKSASEADLDIRKAIALGVYVQPGELIDFLNEIYCSNRFSNMVEVSVKGKRYYAIVKGDGTYIREDYLSSGEYFLINLYRTIKGTAQLIVIDEIDISLDAAAQANLSRCLRSFCARFRCKILFTTHSLALMRQIDDDSELFFMENLNGQASIRLTSYSDAKARLFGFIGWDRYILTEDEVLLGFLKALIGKFCPRVFFRYKIIPMGGGPQVVNLMRQNEREQFLADPEKVISILDGDQKNEKYCQDPRVHMIPIESVEKALYVYRETDPDFPFVSERKDFTGYKDFHYHLQQKKIATQEEIFQYLIEKNDVALQDLVAVLQYFLVDPA
ncbi:putative AbiEii toxin of type IV toxin-antitoxin system [Pseudoduganella lurida]|uniref:Putative AbiEii toxin of type IV toxin-antitoxin system n=1 Tax=Pseudoduganella lurida TaxID=1036180 RepID=A0A562R8P6_9BURK|nr:AAA family ATPase [Pseudoduganella lurida]TWI65425.1 putative AbiEii toxin of type IV toxin-antitoxin system [Pseudoduganella lurida]